MKDFSVTICGKQYPARLTGGAMLAFKAATGHNLPYRDEQEYLTFLWCCASSHCRALGVEFPLAGIDGLNFADHLSPDDMIASISAATAAAEDDTAADDGSDESKKKTKPK